MICYRFMRNNCVLKNSILTTLLLILQCCILGCSDRSPQKKINYAAIKEPLIKANERFVRKESDEIDAYIHTHHLEMLQTATGIRYKVLRPGTGATAKIGQYITMGFTVKLLDGSLCYSSQQKGPRTFKIGEDHVESGLHELATLLSKDEHVLVILPSYLAFGLIGDGGKIPPRASVVYDLNVLRIND